MAEQTHWRSACQLADYSICAGSFSRDSRNDSDPGLSFRSRSIRRWRSTSCMVRLSRSTARALGARLAELVSERRTITLAAISGAAAQAAGAGWAQIAVADRPRDDALLALAQRLCQEE